MGNTNRSRRWFLGAMGALGVPTLAGCSGDDTATPTGTGTVTETATMTETMTETETETATDTPGETPSPDEYLEDANVITIEERKDAESVTISVGVEPDQQAFDPTLLTITSGTTVTWEWSGEGGSHNVVAEDATFVHGETVIEAGHTFQYTFEKSGDWPYYCEPHKINGMKGYVVVEP